MFITWPCLDSFSLECATAQETSLSTSDSRPRRLRFLTDFIRFHMISYDFIRFGPLLRLDGRSGWDVKRCAQRGIARAAGALGSYAKGGDGFNSEASLRAAWMHGPGWCPLYSLFTYKVEWNVITSSHDQQEFRLPALLPRLWTSLKHV